MKQLPKFHIGQEIVCIDDRARYTKVEIKKGDTFIVQGIKQSCCGFVVDIGIPCKEGRIICSGCGNILPTPDGRTWYKEHRFAPIHEEFISISLSRVLENETHLISAN